MSAPITARPDPWTLLTPAQQEIAQLLRSGCTSDRAIARRRGTSPETVRTLMSDMRRRLGVTSRAGIIAVLARSRRAGPPAPLPLPADPWVLLPPAERAIAELLCSGTTATKDLAERLGKAAGTIKRQLDMIRRRLGVRRRAGLVAVLTRSRPAVPVPLTAGERRYAELLCAGLTNREIARAAGVSEVTVKEALERLYERLGVRNRIEAAGRLAPLVLAPAAGAAPAAPGGLDAAA